MFENAVCSILTGFLVFRVLAGISHWECHCERTCWNNRSQYLHLSATCVCARVFWFFHFDHRYSMHALAFKHTFLNGPPSEKTIKNQICIHNEHVALFVNPLLQCASIWQLLILGGVQVLATRVATWMVLRKTDIETKNFAINLLTFLLTCCLENIITVLCAYAYPWQLHLSREMQTLLETSCL